MASTSLFQLACILGKRNTMTGASRSVLITDRNYEVSLMAAQNDKKAAEAA